MNIIPTKKALTLFSNFQKNDSTETTDERSFYDWHANYFTINRKKILVLVNNLSFSPIVLVDINAKNKKDLDAFIQIGIEEVFSYSNVSAEAIANYFLKAGEIKISSTYNRSIIGITNDMIHMIQCSPEQLNFQTILQPELMKWLADTPYRSKNSGYSYSIDVVEEELKKLEN